MRYLSGQHPLRVLEDGIEPVPLDEGGGGGAIPLCGVGLEVEGDVDHGNAGGIPALVPVVVDDAGIHLRRRSDAEGAPVREPFEEDDAAGEVRQSDRIPGGAVGEGEVVDDVSGDVTRLAPDGGGGGEQEGGGQGQLGK